MWLNFVVWGGGNYTRRVITEPRAKKLGIFDLFENSNILLKTFVCGADRRRRREKLRTHPPPLDTALDTLDNTTTIFALNF